ncbi:MAG TPA: response regulator, partial [Thermoanaerobaculia bacterium]|nr:response regulator [Thermoanaerobaculia bacterium]
AGRPLRVLVVEDNRDAAETLGDLLRIFGHEVELAHTGPDGIEAARGFHPEVVLCDIGLPGMDGYAVAEQLRSDPDTTRCRLVALTGYGRDSDRRRAEEAGFDLHLVKPVEPEQLQRLLETWSAGG